MGVNKNRSSEPPQPNPLNQAVKFPSLEAHDDVIISLLGREVC